MNIITLPETGNVLTINLNSEKKIEIPANALLYIAIKLITTKQEGQIRTAVIGRAIQDVFLLASTGECLEGIREYSPKPRTRTIRPINIWDGAKKVKSMEIKEKKHR